MRIWLNANVLGLIPSTTKKAGKTERKDGNTEKGKREGGKRKEKIILEGNC